eukprot:3931942-Rhodomonas_salina.1
MARHAHAQRHLTVGSLGQNRAKEKNTQTVALTDELAQREDEAEGSQPHNLDTSQSSLASLGARWARRSEVGGETRISHKPKQSVTAGTERAVDLEEKHRRQKAVLSAHTISFIEIAQSPSVWRLWAVSS